MFLSVVLMFSPSLFKRLHLQSNKTHIKTTKTNRTTRRQTLTNRKNRNLPARPLEIFVCRGGSWAGYPVFLFCCFMFFFELLCLFYVSLCLFLMFSPSIFKLLHLQSNKNTYNSTKTNINNNSKENIKQKKHINLPAGT